eukprot:g9002.t1
MEDIERTQSLVLRELGAREDIQCTFSLVKAYNETTDEKERLALSTWLETYLTVVSDSAPERFPLEHLKEFAYIGKLSCRDAGHATDIVNRVFLYFRKCVKSGESCSVNVILALEHFLWVVDDRVLEREVDNLSTLVHDLLKKMDPKKHLFNRSTCVSQTAYLLTLERTLIALYGIKEAKLEESTVKFFKQTIKQRLNSIISNQKYFPIAYHAELIKQNIKMLYEKNTSSFLTEVGKTAFLFLHGGLYASQGSGEIAKLKCDLNSIIDGIKEKGQTISQWRCSYVPDLYKISLAAAEALANDDLSIFITCFEDLGSWDKKWKTPMKTLMAKYALIMHLCFFFGENASETTQEQAMDFLKSLSLEERNLRWRAEPILYEGLLDVIMSIAVKCSHHDATCFDIFNQMKLNANEEQRTAIKDFLSDQDFEEKVHNRQVPHIKETSHSLFHIVRDCLGIHQTFSIREKNQKLLINNYKDDNFVKVPLLGSQNGKHVKDFDFNLVVYEQTLIKNETGGLFDQGPYNQVSNNMQRTMRVRKPISMEEIFENRRKNPDGPLEDIQIVLVIGSPGTGKCSSLHDWFYHEVLNLGKTSLSKRLCYDWENGKWGTMFTHVYLLQVRQLGKDIWGSQDDLVEAIINACYNKDCRYGCLEAIRDEVQDCLQKKTTLLILDGLDEGNEEAWKLVDLSLKQPCSLLLLSRPHNVQMLREKVDIEIECLGFNDEHLNRFIARELQANDAKELLQFLRQSSSIWDAARVPINAQIICNMWTSSSKEELKTMKVMNVAWLYKQMANYVWERYTKKDNAKERDRELVFTSLELIAFESLKARKVEIPENLVVEHSKSTSFDILRDAGFLLFMQEGEVFQFAHLTFHEYFAGCHLAKMLDFGKDRDKRKAKRFISEHKYRETSRVTLAFMTGIFCQDNDVEENLECFKTLIDILDDEPVEPIGTQHTLLKMRTLDIFLTCCSNTDELRSTNNRINEIVVAAERILKDWVETDWSFGFYAGMSTIHRRLWEHMIDDLTNLPNLLREYPSLLEIIINNKNIRCFSYHNYFKEVVRVAKLNPQAVGKMAPSIFDELDDELVWRAKEAWSAWIQLCSWIGEECASEALPHLIDAYTKEGHEKSAWLVNPALNLLDVFPDNEDIKRIIQEASEHSDANIRVGALNALGSHRFRSGSSDAKFAWSLQKRAMEDSDVEVKREAFGWLYCTIDNVPDAIDEFIALASKAINDPDVCGSGTNSVRYLLKAAPHREKELLPLLKPLCLHKNDHIRGNALNVVWDIHHESLVSNEKLLSFVSSVCQDGPSDIQYELLPLVSILEAECETTSTSHLVETIVNESNEADEATKRRALECDEAGEILSTNMICQIQSRFSDIQAPVQKEILRQIGKRKLLAPEAIDAIAEMALTTIIEGNDKDQSKFYIDHGDIAFDLLKNIAKESLLSAKVLNVLAARGYKYVLARWKPRNASRTLESRTLEDYRSCLESAICIRKQPLSHLLKYYFESKDDQIVPAIAEKLLMIPVSFTNAPQSRIRVTIVDAGNLVEQLVLLEDYQHLVSLCKEYLKTWLKYKHVS